MALSKLHNTLTIPLAKLYRSSHGCYPECRQASKLNLGIPSISSQFLSL